MKQFHFELRTNKKGETYFVIIAANNEVVATGEGCKNKVDVLDTIDSMIKASPITSIIDKTK
jgi:uncharacterized protein YegP (UPF0339 family)